MQRETDRQRGAERETYIDMQRQTGLEVYSSVHLSGIPIHPSIQRMNRWMDG